jgi:hypothetical protein
MLDKLFAAFLRRADEGTLSRLLVEISVVLASGRSNGTGALRDAAAAYKITVHSESRLESLFARDYNFATLPKGSSSKQWPFSMTCKISMPVTSLGPGREK